MLNVELIEPANSKTHKKNQQVEFKTTENLIINGVVVIPKGTVGMVMYMKCKRQAASAERVYCVLQARKSRR